MVGRRRVDDPFGKDFERRGFSVRLVEKPLYRFLCALGMALNVTEVRRRILTPLDQLEGCYVTAPLIEARGRRGRSARPRRTVMTSFSWDGRGLPRLTPK